MCLPAQPQSRHAFTLIELLCVIAILAMLAALLLPVLNRAKARAQRIACVGRLHEIGTGFHLFANDHRGQFPMQVPLAEGGSAMACGAGSNSGFSVAGAFRHFQALSNELSNPQLLICPADARQAANHFGRLRNENVSYFVNLGAEHGRPTSILAGDRNLTNDWADVGSSFVLGPNSALRWTAELHRYRGNVLFGDTHVEELHGPALRVAAASPATARLEFPVPTPPAGAVAAPKPPTARKEIELSRAITPPMPGGSASTSAAPVQASAGKSAPMREMSSGSGSRRTRPAKVESLRPEPTPRSTPSATNVSTGLARAGGGTPESEMGIIDLELVHFLHRLMGWTYLLLLLLLLTYLSVRWWLWWRARQSHAERRTQLPD